jgi:transposase
LSFGGWVDQNGCVRKKHVRSKRVFRRSQEPKLLPPSVEETLGPEELCRHVLAVVQGMDLTSLRELYDDKGGVPYPPDRMLAMLCFALMEGDRSSRVIQKRCRYDDRYKYLMGGLQPDDRTVCRFRSRLEPVLPELFSQIVKELKGRGLVRGRLVAVDGTKVEGNVNQWRKVLASADSEDAGSGLSDPDVRTMRTRGGYVTGYNLQVGVDADTHAVVAVDVGNETRDMERLPGLVEQAEENLGEAPKAVVADAGYDSAENAASLESKGVSSFIRPRDGHAEFWSLGEKGCLVCPRGHRVKLLDRYSSRGKRRERYYVAECPGCELRESCEAGRHKYLVAPAGVDPRARVLNAHRCRSPEGSEALLLRATAVEGVFGHIKWNLGYRRFLRRGLRNVKAEALLLALAYDIRLAAAGLLRLIRRLLFLPEARHVARTARSAA